MPRPKRSRKRGQIVGDHVDGLAGGQIDGRRIAEPGLRREPDPATCLPSTSTLKPSSPEAAARTRYLPAFSGLVGGGVADAARMSCPRASHATRFRVGNGVGGGGFRRAGEVLAGVGGHLDGALPVGLPKTCVHLGQAAGVKHVHVGADQIGDAGDDADGLEGLRLRRAAAAGDRRPSVWADDGDGLDLCRDRAAAGGASFLSRVMLSSAPSRATARSATEYVESAGSNCGRSRKP